MSVQTVMNAWNEIWPGVTLRVLQSVVWASPYLLFGVGVAGVLRATVPAETTRRLFGGRGWRATLRLFCVAVLLPLSSFGVLPVVRELRRAGVRRDAVLFFLLTAPVLNPLTIAYAFSVMRPVVAAAIVVGCFLIPAVAVALAARWLPETAESRSAGAGNASEGRGPLPATAPRRLLFAFLTAAREMAGPALLDLCVGLVGVALVAALTPDEWLDHTIAKPGLLAPLVAVPVAVPAYLSPDKAVGAFGTGASEGNSFGALFVLLILGAGVNLAWLLRVGRGYGWKLTLTLTATVVFLCLAYGYGGDALLPRVRSYVDHHHALSDLGLPDGLGTGVAALRLIPANVVRTLTPEWSIALAGMAVLAAAGLCLRAVDPRGRVERSLAAAPSAVSAPGGPRFWNRPLSGRRLAAGAALGVVVLVVVGLYVYYPPPAVLLEDMRYAASDSVVAAITGEKQIALERAQKLDNLAAHMPFSLILRTGRLHPDGRAEAAELRREIATFRRTVLTGNTPAIKAEGFALEERLKRCRHSALHLHEPAFAGATP